MKDEAAEVRDNLYFLVYGLNNKTEGQIYQKYQFCLQLEQKFKLIAGLKVSIPLKWILLDLA